MNIGAYFDEGHVLAKKYVGLKMSDGLETGSSV
jgi:hypothetical protein